MFQKYISHIHLLNHFAINQYIFNHPHELFFHIHFIYHFSIILNILIHPATIIYLFLIFYFFYSMFLNKLN